MNSTRQLLDANGDRPTVVTLALLFVYGDEIRRYEYLLDNVRYEEERPSEFERVWEELAPGEPQTIRLVFIAQDEDAKHGMAAFDCRQLVQAWAHP